MKNLFSLLICEANQVLINCYKAILIIKSQAKLLKTILIACILNTVPKA